MGANSTFDEPDTWVRLFGAVSYLVFTLISLAANILLFIVIYKVRFFKKVKNLWNFEIFKNSSEF